MTLDEQIEILKRSVVRIYTGDEKLRLEWPALRCAPPSSDVIGGLPVDGCFVFQTNVDGVQLFVEPRVRVLALEKLPPERFGHKLRFIVELETLPLQEPPTQ